MKLIVFSMLATLFFVFSVNAQTAVNFSKTNIEPTLRLEIENGKTLDLKLADFAKLPHREVHIHNQDGKETVYEGVEVRDVLQSGGIKFGKEFDHVNLSKFLTVEAADKYRVGFAFAELDPDFSDRVVLLADKADGKPLSEKQGHWQIVVPDDKRRGRWVHQVIKLTVTATDSKVASVMENKSNVEDLIREIVLRKILKSWSPDSNENLKVYYLSVDGGKDPSENLLKKFADYKVPIKKVSESFISANDGDMVLDVNTQKQGVLFTFSKLDWKNNDEVEVSAGSYLGNMGSDGCLYILKRETGEWKIISTEKCFVS